MTGDSSNHALVIGASGITGWGILHSLLTYPTPTAWSSVVGLTSRPLSRADALLPQEDNKRIRLHSGFDLITPNSGEVVKMLKGVEGIEMLGGFSTTPYRLILDVLFGSSLSSPEFLTTGDLQVTHVFYAAYATKNASTPHEIKVLNVEMLRTALDAVEACCPNVQFITLQTGGKFYGVEFADELTFKTPFVETLPRIPLPYADDIFYYGQVNLMAERSEASSRRQPVGSNKKAKAWKWADIRPDAIVGFVPQNNLMGIAQATAVFLSVYRFVHGAGAEVRFPGDRASFKAAHTDTSQDILARFTIFVSLNGDVTHGKAYNIGDGDESVSWEKIWPAICSYFGLRGVGPSDAANGSIESVKSFMDDHKKDWESWIEQDKLKRGSLSGSSWDFMSGLMERSGFDREYDLGAARELGFTDTVDTVAGYYIAFDRMRTAGIIS